MKYKAIIFDMDGTIVDTNPLWDATVLRLAQAKGITDPKIIAAIQQEICGLSVTRACERIKEISNIPDSFESLMQEKMKIALSIYKTKISFIKGFEAFHALVKKHPLKVAIATNADDATFAITKDTLELHTFFAEHMYNISSVNNICKPNPHIYLHAAEKLGVKPAECIAIEDSYAGILAAKRAGMKCIGINTNKNRKALELADLIIEGYEELTMDTIKEL